MKRREEADRGRRKKREDAKSCVIRTRVRERGREVKGVMTRDGWMCVDVWQSKWRNACEFRSSGLPYPVSHFIVSRCLSLLWLLFCAVGTHAQSTNWVVKKRSDKSRTRKMSMALSAGKIFEWQWNVQWKCVFLSRQCLCNQRDYSQEIEDLWS